MPGSAGAICVAAPADSLGGWDDTGSRVAVHFNRIQPKHGIQGRGPFFFGVVDWGTPLGADSKRAGSK